MARKVKTEPKGRVWLNDDGHSTALVTWNVGKYDGELAIGDCYRVARLDFSDDGALVKLDRLILALTKFRAALKEKADA